jgi:NAD-dependent DNA ligase
MSNFFARQGAAYANDMKRSLGALVGIAQGALCDGHLSDQEITFLDKWLTENDAIANEWPGDVIHARVRAALSDGVITEAERAHLLSTLTDLIGGSVEQAAQRAQVTSLAFDPVDRVIFPASSFCLTGDFVYAPRESCISAIETRGGTVGGVTKKLRYLIVGSRGSSEWKHGSFGTKVEKAMQFKRAGSPILIVAEEKWAASL